MTNILSEITNVSLSHTGVELVDKIRTQRTNDCFIALLTLTQSVNVQLVSWLGLLAVSVNNKGEC